MAGCSNVPYPKGMAAQNIYFTYVAQEPASFDPSYSYDTYDGPIVGLLYPAYFRFQFLHRTPFTIETDLGTKQPTVEHLLVTDIDKEGHTKKVKGERWSFTIRKDIKFQDDPCFPGGKGRQATAADIVYSFKRMADPKVNSPIASYLADKIVGFAADEDGFKKNGKAQYDQELTGVKVDPKDPFSFSVTLNQPYPQLNYIMAMAFTTPQAREAVETYGDQYALHHPVGCGLFYLKEYRAHQDVMLVRNPNAYYSTFPTTADDRLKPLLADAGKQVPFLDGIHISILTEAVTAYNLFQQGYLDDLSIDSANSNIVPISSNLNGEMAARGVRLATNRNVSTYYLAFNMADSVVGGYTPEKRKLREAISLAVDSQSVIDLVAAGMGTPAQWLVPPGIFGYEPDYKNPYRQYDPNLTRAKQLLAEAGYPGGIDPATGQRLVIHYDVAIASPSDRESTRQVQKMVQALGIQVEIRGTSFPLFDQKIRKKQDQMFSYSWFADYPDPENFTFLFYSPNSPPGPNHTGYHNPEYDKLFEQMRGMQDGPERLAIIRKMRAISVEDCPWIYMRHSEDRTLIQPWTFNESAHPMDNGENKYIRIDPAMRLRLQEAWNHATIWPLFALLAVLAVGLFPAVRTIKGRMNRRVRRAG